MTVSVFDETACTLGEGPMWHPLLNRLFWFDILQNRMFARAPGDTAAQTWQFDRNVSAAGWVDADRMGICTEEGLELLTLATGEREMICPIEQDNPNTRANDSRVDPHGGFWIGTMGKDFQPGAGAIYRYYRGELRTLFPDITVPNSICFAPDGLTAYFTDSTQKKVMRQRLAPADGWPLGPPEVFFDTRGEKWANDGAVVDAEGNLVSALWGGWRVQVYGPDGKPKDKFALPASNITCPAFGGPNNATLFVTSALEGVPESSREKSNDHGKTFALSTPLRGQPENQLIL